MALRPYQEEVKQAVLSEWADGKQVVVAVMPTGAGKCLGEGTPVLMYDGTIRMVESIKTEELLMGPDSTPRRVLSTCSGEEMLYKVTPVKGEPYIVNESHILSLKQTGLKAKPKYPCQFGKGKVVNISIQDYLNSSKHFKHTHKGWRTGINFGEKRVFPSELPPYLLGLWLGDGTSRSPEFTTADLEVVNYLREYAVSHGFKLTTRLQPNNASSVYHISSRYQRIGLRQHLRANNLLRNKHIPHRYLTGSIEQRLELLAGIIDSDGFMNHNGYDLVFKVEQLAKDVIYLARSLGFAAYIKPCKKTCSNTGATGDYFRISISGSPYVIPVKISRYQNVQRLQKKDVLVTGIKVEPIGTGKYYGFEIDGDHLFMLGDFTVTHNTVLLSDIFKAHVGASCVIAHRQELVSQISLALAREGVSHRIVGPDSIVKLCVQLHMSEVGRSWFSPSAHCAVAGVDTLIRREAELRNWLPSVTLWAIDECFPAGTMIGAKPIEHIKVGDVVSAFNEASQQLELRKVTHLFKNKAPYMMVEVKLKSHHSTISTSGHPFYTKRGWVTAENLTTKDEVLTDGLPMQSLWESSTDYNRESTLPIQENGESILSKIMCVYRTRFSKRLKSSNSKTFKTRYFRELLNLWYPYSNSTIRPNIKAKRWGKYILFKELFQRILPKSLFLNNGKNKSEVRFATNDREQSYDSPRNSREGLSYSQIEGAPTESKRWEWSRSHRCGENSFTFICRLRIFITAYFKNKRMESPIRMSIPLQNRLRTSYLKNCDRSRWQFPFLTQTKRARPQERGIPKWERVESVSLLKRDDLWESRDCSFDGFVYNIEVEGLHTYVANGVVVHNCHHVVLDNKWGKAVEMFINAKGLGVTATPMRADGKGLGRHADGVADAMVEGPSMRWLINQKFLTEYRVFAPPSDLDLSDVKIGATGDYSHDSLVTATRKSHVMGDVVEHYLRIAPGKLGITFATDVKSAQEIAERFCVAGVPAMSLDAKTPAHERIAVLRKFKNREILQVVNVDLFGEGFDLPAIEVVSMARATQSYGMFVQVFGRALRLLEGKEYALIIDHVGNVVRHGLPDAPRKWSLDRREKRASKAKDPDVIPVRSCPECTAVYERIYRECPYCGFVPVPAGRSAPEQVDGDLAELDAETLARMRGEIARVNMTMEEKAIELAQKRAPLIGQRAGLNRHRELLSTHKVLADQLAWWGGHRSAEGMPDSEIQRRFYFRFGIDVLSAQALPRREAEELIELLAIDNYVS